MAVLHEDEFAYYNAKIVALVKATVEKEVKEYVDHNHFLYVTHIYPDPGYVIDKDPGARWSSNHAFMVRILAIDGGTISVSDDATSKFYFFGYDIKNNSVVYKEISKSSPYTVPSRSEMIGIIVPF